MPSCQDQGAATSARAVAMATFLVPLLLWILTAGRLVAPEGVRNAAGASRGRRRPRAVASARASGRRAFSVAARRIFSARRWLGLRGSILVLLPCCACAVGTTTAAAAGAGALVASAICVGASVPISFRISFRSVGHLVRHLWLALALGCARGGRGDTSYNSGISGGGSAVLQCEDLLVFRPQLVGYSESITHFEDFYVVFAYWFPTLLTRLPDPSAVLRRAVADAEVVAKSQENRMVGRGVTLAICNDLILSTSANVQLLAILQ